MIIIMIMIMIIDNIYHWSASYGHQQQHNVLSLLTSDSLTPPTEGQC